MVKMSILGIKLPKKFVLYQIDMDVSLMNISYDYYRIFYYVAKCGSFTGAANALLNNQPNITRAIKTLEYELGCTLFIRSNKGVTLTPEGVCLSSGSAVR